MAVTLKKQAFYIRDGQEYTDPGIFISDVPAAVEAVGEQQIELVQDKGDEVLASIPQDYTALSEDVSELKHFFNNTTESLLDENLIPINVGIVNPHVSQIANAANKGVTVTVTGQNKFKMNGTATAQFELAFDYDAGTGKPLLAIERNPVYFILKRSDGLINVSDCHVTLTYFNSNNEAVLTNDKIKIFNSIVKHTYNSAAAKFRTYMVVKSGASFDNVEFEYIALFAKPLSEYIMPGMITENYDNIPLTFERKTGYYASNGTFSTYSDIWGATVSVTPTRKYRLNYMSYYAASETVFFDSNGDLIQAVTSHNDNAQYNKDFYVPINATTMLIQAYGVTEENVSGRTALSYLSGKRLDGSTLDVYEIPYKSSDVGTALDIALQNTNKSVLFGKKIAYNGDSICESRLTGTAANGGGYAKLIADATGGTYDNKAVSGGILASAVPSGTMPHSVDGTVLQMPDDADLYCFEGGVNDFWRNVPLGDYSPTDYKATLDTTTVCGALEHIFRVCRYYHIGKPIVFIIVHKATGTINPNDAGYTFDQMREKMIGICEKFAIPYYDAYTKSGLNGYDDEQNVTFLTANASGRGDGIHPNEAGYRRYYVPQLIALFESLMPVLE